MSRAAPRPRAVLLPGSGSDAVFVRRVFGGALDALGVDLVAVDPDPADVVGSARAALADAARTAGPLLLGGVSLGAAVAVGWALAHPGRVDGLLLAMPAWWGDPAGAPAAVAAIASAAALRRHGLDVVLAEVAATAPGWVAVELDRAWRCQGADLPAALERAAAHRAPSERRLARLDVPVGLGGVRDDPLHPEAVARAAERVLPRAACVVVDLAEVGAEPGTLGSAAVSGLVRAGWHPPAQPSGGG